MFCAQAGAAKVYAVEAAAGLVNLIREVVAKNGFSHLIEVGIFISRTSGGKERK